MPGAAALICLALPAALTLPSAPAEPTDGAAAVDPAPPIRAELAAGLRAIARSAPLARATVTSVVSCAGQGMLVACGPLLGARALGAADRGALLLSATAAAALVTTALLARRPPPMPRLLRPDAVLRAATLVLAAALLLVATGWPPLVVAGALLVGVGEGPQLSALIAVRHREAPPRLRGQVFTTGASLKTTGWALGAGLAGLGADRSLTGTLLAAGGVLLLGALAGAGCRGRHDGHPPPITTAQSRS
ncbi:hypothetical protein GCM10009665_11550 [Kitasatospora nipponensis]|uniref:MFS transporter n=1 Tax=Kitasatospora nipponensis TaxID=258049 RepID=A0ABN1VX68_9ACTN